MALERPALRPASPLDVARDLSLRDAMNALVAFVFATTGPIAILLAVAAKGRLSEPQVASWIFGAFFVNGIVSLVFSMIYRQPLVMLWSIPGTVLAGPALATMGFGEVTGAFLGCGALMLVLGLTGWVGRVMRAIPMPIVMGMVAGVFLKFALDWLIALRDAFAIAGPMTAAFVALSAWPAVARRVPPLIAALLVGIGAALLTGRFAPDLATVHLLAEPALQVPELSWRAMVELVIPFTIAVLVVQNGQGMAVLMGAGHSPPINAVACACGAASLVTGLFGAVNTCLTGPLSAILTESPDRRGHYAGAVIACLLLIVFGLLAPLFTRLLMAAPAALIATLGGLAMLRILEGSFVTAFKGRFTLGALVTFLVTISEIAILNIGAPFWGLVLGYLTARVLEPGAFADEPPRT